jgi:putative transposase
MSNHPHITGQIDAAQSSILALSRIFQSANSLFGRWYNRLHQRSGKVAEERFKTLRVEDDRSLQRVMFYSDSNPVRAGLVKHPRDYPWSSYRYYALGERSSYTELLSQPEWYRALGRTAKLRQRAYRRLADAYLRSSGLLRDTALTRGNFIGADDFVARQTDELHEALRELRAALSTVHPP